MGLDTVELVIRFEDAFGVAIPDDVAAELTTPRQVTFYLLSQLQLTDKGSCSTQQAFYALRKEFTSTLGVARAEFRPSVKLAHLIPVEGRIEAWATLRSRTALPDLERSATLFSTLVALTILTAITAFIVARAASGSNNVAFVSSALVLTAVGWGSARVTRPLKREFPQEYQDAGELARYLEINIPHTFKKTWTREEVAQMVRRIIVDQTGITDFTEDSRFTTDMHLD